MTKDFLADESAFRHMLSGFPSRCLVVPFQDPHSRDSICHSLDFTTPAKGHFVLPTVRKVLWNQYLSVFRYFGADAFPFTDEVLEECDRQGYIRPVKGSLESLLLCPPSSRLYENSPVDPDSIGVASISQIQQKLVGLYLCLDGDSIPKLHQLYQDCKANNIAFEVLVVYSAFPLRNPDPYFFIKLINCALHKRNIRWWAFPFNSWISLRLKRLCLYPREDELIIVGNGLVDFKGKYFISEQGKTDIDEFKRRYQTFMPGGVQHNVLNVKRWSLDRVYEYEGLPTLSPHFSAEKTAGVNTNVKACGETRRIIPNPPIIRTWSNLNVSSFLSTHLQNPKGLIRCSTNKDIVGFDVLEGKVVMICCFSLSFGYQSPDISLARSVALAFPDLYVFGGSELVLAVNVYGGGPKEFDEFLSLFPSSCLAVPYSDGKAICDSLKFDCLPKPCGVLVNRNETVLWCSSLDFFSSYGADAFPFTPERLSEITDREKNLKLWKKWRPLEDLLCSDLLPSPRSFSFLRKNPQGGPEKKCIRDFEDTRVGLYLCQTGDLIPTLDEVHKICCELDREFEIVLVYLPFRHAGDPQLFQDKINNLLKKHNISWWVLPFVYWVSRMLWRLCHKDDGDRLIIIDPESRFVELHGEAVITLGVSAYPFSRKDVIKQELDRLKRVTLESLLVHSSRDYVLSTGNSACRKGKKFPVAELRGRNVILFLYCEGDDGKRLYDVLIHYCSPKKPSDRSPEVVVVALDKSFPKSGGRSMPWLKCPFNQEHSSFVCKTIFRKGKRSTLLSFGTDGEICSVCWHVNPIVTLICSVRKCCL